MNLCIGTVQLGMDYGITGQKQPSVEQACEILDYATQNGIKTIDTANAYGTAEDVVSAVVAIEKVFRMFMPASALRTDYISVDKQIDLFLKKYFNLYNEYCLDKTESSEDYVFSNYIDYEYLMEDEQKDDLTLFVMKYR